MTITAISPLRAARDTRLITTCTSCTSLCVQVRPGVFEHLRDACRECFGTGRPCAYPELHGVHEYFERGTGRVPCTEAVAHECGWCVRVLDAAELPCPDHRDCCGCCEPR